MVKKNNEIKERLKALYDIMNSESLDVLEVDSKEYKVYIKRKNTVETDDEGAAGGSQLHLGVNAPKVQPEPPQPAEEVKPVADTKPPLPVGDTIKSPITGMFYRSSAPSVPPFVVEGDIVDGGKTLCIVEAMKVMNEIKAPFKLQIVKILAENAKAVTMGQDLFIIEKV